jgi:hypothetical protein
VKVLILITEFSHIPSSKQASDIGYMGYRPECFFEIERPFQKVVWAHLVWLLDLSPDNHKIITLITEVLLE